MLQERKYRLDDLHTFVLVAEHGSLSGAADVLGTPASTVGRRVRRLEDALGVALLHRESRRVGLTADGEALWRRCRTPLRELDDVTAGLELEDGEVQGQLRVTMGVGGPGRPGVGDMFAAFIAQWPGVQLDLRVSNRIIDLVEEGVDVAIRPYTPRTPLHSADLRLRRLGGSPFGLFAAPGLADLSLDALDGRLVGHPILRMAPVLAQRFSGWAALQGKRAAAVSDDFDSVVALAVAGVGVGVAPELTARVPLDDGRLVRLLPELDLGGSELCLMWPASRHLAPRVRAFVDHCAAWAPRMGLLPPGTWPLGSA